MAKSQSLQPVSRTLFAKRVFANVTKDLKMSSSWISDGPKSNGRCVFIRGRFVRGRGWGDTAINQRTFGATRAGGGRDVFPPRAFGGSPALPVLQFQVLASRTVRE